MQTSQQFELSLLKNRPQGASNLKILTADFIGASFPPETKVWFETQTSIIRNGTVQRLFPQYARVAAEDGTLWEVPYRLLTVREPIQEPAMSIFEIDALGNQLLQEHQDKSGP